MNTAEKNLFQAQLLIEELRRHGVTKFVVCPGSRSSALALALSLEKRVECIVHHDERGAGYYAVGYARATGRAAAVVTTSGTAAVNLFPAIVEASQDNLPLIALTADRPPELHERGVNQTIDQQNLFGTHVRLFANLPCPDDGELTDLRHTIDQVCRHASCDRSDPGPVHINCMYREPLVPLPDKVQPFKPPDSNEADATPAPVPDVAALDEIARIVRAAKRGLLLVGHLRSEAEHKAMLELIARLGWPTIVDITSGLSAAQQPLIVAHHDLILASDSFTIAHTPDTILHVGGRLTSKRLLQFIEKAHPANYLFNAGNNIIYDPVGAVTRRTTADTTTFCRHVTDVIGTSAVDPFWCNAWQAATATGRQLIAKLCDDQTLTEPTLAFILSRQISDHTGIFLASSMPIRDMNTFAALRSTLSVAANRGASGIDGTIASACGYADGLNHPVTLLIGDQAFLHDLSSLSLIAAVRRPVTIVVINNQGGRIFESLPVSEHREALDRFFIAPHKLSFEKFAGTFDIAYYHPKDIKTFCTDYESATASAQAVIIEASVDPVASREHRNRILNDVRAAVDSLKP
jgi:2-succinyl-5-enolpyruvyl-6-hydroxy-3-cyclohexene-1-carboxylate synthase